jgi:cell division septation protein DedD
MGYLLRLLAFAAVLMAGVLPLAAFDGPTQTKADSKKAAASGKAGEEKKADAAEPDKTAGTASRMLEAGIKAYQAGNTSQAIRAFDTALRAGGLASQQTATALYYRGMSYRKKGKPGLAISDLTSAAWLKDGLSPAEKQEAMSNRIAAYREAGIGDVPELDQSPVLAGSGWQTAMDNAKSPPAASPPPPTAPPPAYAAPPAYSAPAAPPAPAPVQTSSGSSSGGGFFDSITSLFGGGSSSSAAPSQDEVTTASIADPPGAAATWQTTAPVTATAPPPARPAPQAAPPARPAPHAEALPWASPSAPHDTPPPQAAPPPRPAPAAADSGFATQVATAPPPRAETPAAAAAEPAGKFHVQVAAVRTRSEAYALAVRLVSQHGSELGGRKPLVDDTVIGSMGTFYRVRLGPYASAKEPQHLCGSLRSSGFDCLVVTQ